MKKNTILRALAVLLAAAVAAVMLCTVCAAQNNIARDAADGIESAVDGAGNVISDAASDIRDGADSIRDDIESRSHTESVAHSEDVGEDAHGSGAAWIAIAVIVAAVVVIVVIALARRAR